MARKVKISKPPTKLASLTDTRDDYIRTLEMSLQILQREVESLRNLNKSSESAKTNHQQKKLKTIKDEASDYFTNCNSDKELHSKFFNLISGPYSILESDIFLFQPDGTLQSVSESDTLESFLETVRHLEEEGIIDFAVERDSPSLLPNLSDDDAEIPTHILLVPFIFRGTAIGIFVGKTNKNPTEINRSELQEIKDLSESAALALDNLRSAREIHDMNNRLALLNSQILHSSKLASIGEIASAIASEISNPIQIIRANINLIGSGLGDVGRRTQIIINQLDKIDEITNRLTDFSDATPSGIQATQVNICTLIDDVLLISASQLQRDGIKVEREYENQSLEIAAFKPQIEQVILSLLLFGRDYMPDGGTISICVVTSGKNKIQVSIADSGTGIDEQLLKNIFNLQEISDTGTERKSQNLYLVKNIVQQHNGKISVYSEIGKGTTFKIIFPLLSN
ncbi:MAG: two-component sensor histidine kinase [Ignavibacteria bacterium]|nr:two-component sensor histidine kinase [Ignavibacteria bacterium]